MRAVGSRLSRRQPMRAAVDRPTLAAGLGVVTAVGALLVLLRRTVGKLLNTHVTDVWTAGSRLAQHTSQAHLLRTTKVLSEELVEELERHVEASKGSRA